jgi:hypothetical protein
MYESVRLSLILLFLCYRLLFLPSLNRRYA